METEEVQDAELGQHTARSNEGQLETKLVLCNTQTHSEDFLGETILFSAILSYILHTVRSNGKTLRHDC